MKILDYNKETGEFKLTLTGKLDDNHKEFLKKAVGGNVEEMLTEFDQNKFDAYINLKDWGMLESHYDHSEKESVTEMSDTGKVLVGLIK